ncbi:MAG: hypothetical protein EOO40_08080 [Deltaproteobacteria bacterium]|nr:MAG: hypothetical protein EOO40_08080 [Deltaproteobacteria bacterium]
MTASALDTFTSQDDPLTLDSVPWLRTLNTAGAVTTNSQVGVPSVTYQQRAYVDGVAHASLRPTLDMLGHSTEILVWTAPGDARPSPADVDTLFEYGARLPLTMRRHSTRQAWTVTAWTPPLLSFDREWSSLLPQGLAGDHHLRDQCRREGIVFRLVDPVWGRKLHLCQVAASWLRQ